MITERQFASSFPDFWQELLPLLTPSCVHLLNAGHEERLQDESGVEIDAVEASEETRDVAVVSEFAYHLAREAFQRSLSVSDAFDDNTIRSVAQASAIDLVNRYEGRNVLPDANLNAAEMDEGLELAIRYESFARLHGGQRDALFKFQSKDAVFFRHAALIW